MLHNSNTLELLTAVMDTLNRFATIWACMDVMGQIVDSLFSAHQVWKTRGIQSRQLFVLLMEFDNRRYLSDECREQLSADLSSFTIVSVISFGSLSDRISPRLCNLIQAFQILFPRSFRRSFSLQTILLLMHHHCWLTVFG